MNSKIRILKLLISDRETRFTIKKISEALKINYRIAYEKILEFENEKVIRTTKAGNSKICEFTNRFNHNVFEAEYERKEEIFKNKDLLILHNRLAELQFPFIALLFFLLAPLFYLLSLFQKTSDQKICAKYHGDAYKLPRRNSLFKKRYCKNHNPDEKRFMNESGVDRRCLRESRKIKCKWY